MDAEKLLNLLYTLDLANDKEGLTALFKELNEFLASSDTSAIENKKEQIYKVLDESTLNSLPYSDAEALEKIGADIYFGKTAKSFLEKFFNTNGHLLQSNITEYVAGRQKFIEELNETKKNLKNLQFTPHYSEDEYELGITLPDRFRNLGEAAKAIQDWNNFLSYIASVNGESTQIKISLVSEGSITLFVLASAAMAKTINVFMGEIATFYEQIGRIKKVQLETRFLESKVIGEELKTKMEEERAKFVSGVTQKMLSDLNVDAAAMNNSTAELAGRVKKILTLTEKGARLELIPPEPDFEDVETSQKFSKTEQKKILEQIEQTHKINERITPLYLGIGTDSLLLEEETETEVLADEEKVNVEQPPASEEKDNLEEQSNSKDIVS